VNTLLLDARNELGDAEGRRGRDHRAAGAGAEVEAAAAAKVLWFRGRPASRMLSMSAFIFPWKRFPLGFTKCTAGMSADLALAAMVRPTSAAAFLSLRFGRLSRTSFSLVLAEARICARDTAGGSTAKVRGSLG